jgi:hypothetical protein
LEPLAGLPLVKSLEHFRRVRGNVALHDIHRMKLPEETDHLFLGRGIVPETGPARLPDVLDRTLPVHQPDQKIGRRREALEPPGGMVLENVPDLPAIFVPVNFHMAAQPGLQPRHAVPGGTIKGSWHNFYILNSKSEARNTKQIQNPNV